MNALLDQFLSESREALEGISEMLLQLEGAPADETLMTHLFRLVHTLKGNSGLFDVPEMTRVLHAGEDLMDAVRQGQVPYSQALADVLLDAVDFVGLLCNDLEAGDGQGASHGEEALRLSQALRALIGTGAPAVTAGEPAHQAGTSYNVPTLDDWLRLPEATRQAAAALHSGGSPLTWVRYTPDEGCFFQGEDPLHRAMQTPGVIWGGIREREAWPAPAELDAYRCMLDFDVLSSAETLAIEEHFRYVPEQRVLHPLNGSGLAGWMAEPAASAEARAAALHELVETQRTVLTLPAELPWSSGRVEAAVAALQTCLTRAGREADLPSLQAAAAAALQAQTHAPLAQWLAKTLPPEAAAEELPLAEQEVATTRRAEDAAAPRSLRVEQAKIDRLMNLIGEMVVAKNAIPYLAQRAETTYGVRELSREIKAQYAVVNRICDEMQDAIMQVRMLPVSFVFQRFPRLVRDTARRLGKEVELTLQGEQTAADKNIIEALADPLIHIVRNSLDHGLERPEQRRAAGKPEAGRLRISATQEADRVVIEISDDGQGINPALVKRKAVEKGLIDEAAAMRLSDAEAQQLIFAPGFSTADVVSDLSGRGVGMDVVRTAVERVNGSIALDSVVGQGTRIRLSLPLSMAITRVMTLEADGQSFGVPMDMVVETVRVPRSAVRQIKHDLVTVLRGKVVPLRALNAVLGLAAPPLCNGDDEYAVLVVRVGDATLGLLVDEFRDTADIILKPLAGVLAQIRAYSGSALMGDGSVLMVLNIKEMLA